MTIVVRKAVCLLLLALLLGSPALAKKCPEGTVKCKIKEITIEWDGTKLKLKIKSYKTCVSPGQCPPPSFDSAPSSGGEELAAVVGRELAGGTVKLEAKDLQFNLNSLRGSLGRIETATAVVKASSYDAKGQLIEQHELTTGLKVVVDRGAEWILTPVQEGDLDEFIPGAARVLLDGQADEDVVLEYEIVLTFDHAPSNLTSEDISSEFKLGGLMLD